MIKLVVGLGNPGRQYEKTRHNAGFLFLDVLVDSLGCSWVRESKFQGMFSSCSVSGQKLMLLKPETYMNRSGNSVGKVVSFFKLLPEQVLVVHDELDFDVGVVKLKKGGGHAGHNGLRDIIEHLGTNEFYRLRIGIGRPLGGKKIADFVLSVPSGIEMEKLMGSVNLGKEFVDQMVQGDMALVMNKLNA